MNDLAALLSQRPQQQSQQSIFSHSLTEDKLNANLGVKLKYGTL